MSSLDSRFARSLAWVLVLLFGVWVRVFGLGSGIVSGDEIHSILVAKDRPLGYILSHFHQNDYCIPLTAWCRLMVLTGGLEEWSLRVLSIVPGVLLLVLLPRLVRGFLGRFDQLLLGLVLAASPLMVFWSRTGRPYSMIALLGTLSVPLLLRYLAAPSARRLVPPLLAQAGLLYFSPTTLPAIGALGVGALLLSGDAGRARPASRARALLQGILPTLLAVVVAMSLLVAALPSLGEILTTKLHADRVTFTTALKSARMLFGFPVGEDTLLVLLLLGCVVAGLWRVRAEHSRFFLPALVVLFLPGLTYLFRPVHCIALPHVFLRYQAAFLPLWWAVAGYGFAGLRRSWLRWEWSRGIAALLALLLVSVQIAGGPLSLGYPLRAPFGTQGTPFRFPGCRVDETRVPPFYRNLAREKGVATVVEWPALAEHSKLFRSYQALHGSRVVRCHPFSTSSAGVSFRTLVLGLENLRDEHRPAYIVLHRKPNLEFFFMMHPDPLPTVGGRTPEAQVAACPDEYNLEAAIRKGRELYGPPCYEDLWIVVFREE